MTKFELYKRNVRNIGYLAGEFEQSVFFDTDTHEIIVEVNQDEKFIVVSKINENDTIKAEIKTEEMFENYYNQ